MTKARIKCRRCKNYIQYDIKRENVTCNNCGFTFSVVGSSGFDGLRTDDSNFRWR